MYEIWVLYLIKNFLDMSLCDEFLFCNQQAIQFVVVIIIIFSPLKKFQVFNKFCHGWSLTSVNKSCVPHEVACMGSYFALNKPSKKILF